MPDFVSRSVTLLFTDVEGSTELLVRLGERYAELLDDHRAVLRNAVADAGGREIDCRGEEFFIAFPLAQNCVTAAVAAQRALNALRWPEDVEPRVRMGIHTGEPAIRDEGYLGLDVHRAARICAAGHGGQILVSQTTYDLLRDQERRTTAFRDLGEHHLKGLPRAERIFQVVVNDLPSAFPPLRVTQPPERSVFAGRERALAGAARAAVIRSRRVGRTLWSIRQRPATPPGFADLGWQLRDLLPTASQSLQRPLAELGGALFSAARSVVEVDRFLATVDRQALSRSFKEYRDMGVTSTRAAREADVVAGQIDQLERVAERRRAIGRLREDIAERVAALEQQIAEDPSGSNRLSEELIGLGGHIQTATGELDQALEPVRSLASTNMKLRRTLYRGVYASGDRYVVPYFDGLGIEQRPKFETLGEARRLAWVRRREERQREFADGHLPSGYDRPTHGSGSNP